MTALMDLNVAWDAWRVSSSQFVLSIPYVFVRTISEEEFKDGSKKWVGWKGEGREE